MLYLHIGPWLISFICSVQSPSSIGKRMCFLLKSRASESSVAQSSTSSKQENWILMIHWWRKKHKWRHCSDFSNILHVDSERASFLQIFWTICYECWFKLRCGCCTAHNCPTTQSKTERLLIFSSWPNNNLSPWSFSLTYLQKALCQEGSWQANLSKSHWREVRPPRDFKRNFFK